MAEDNILSSPKASSQEDATSMSSKSPQTPLDQADKESSLQAFERQKLVLSSKKMKLEESKIKLEEDFAFKAAQERQKYEQHLRQNELAIEAVLLVVRTQELAAAKEASKEEAKTLKESKSSDRKLHLAEAYQQYQAELLQVEKDFAENSFRKGTVSVPKIAREHFMHPKTLLT